MAERIGAVTVDGNPMTLVGNEIRIGDSVPDVTLLANDMSPVSLKDFAGKTVILTTLPSLDTSVCDTETRTFNQKAAELGEDVVILAVSVDLPFAQARWCAAAGVEQVQTLSDHRETALGLSLGLLIKEARLLARAVLVIDKNGVVQYIQLVPEVGQEPDYEAVLAATKKLL